MVSHKFDDPFRGLRLSHQRQIVNACGKTNYGRKLRLLDIKLRQLGVPMDARNALFLEDFFAREDVVIFKDELQESLCPLFSKKRTERVEIADFIALKDEVVKC